MLLFVVKTLIMCYTMPRNTRGQSLLSGNVFCGHCGGRLTLTTNGTTRINAAGEKVGRKRIRYVCYNKTRKRSNCDGQTGYTMHILDKMVTDIHNKNVYALGWDQYTWNEVPNSHQVKDRADELKKAGLWQKVRDRYLEKKNMYLFRQNHDHPSFVVYVESVNEVYNKYFNGGGWHNVQSIL